MLHHYIYYSNYMQLVLNFGFEDWFVWQMCFALKALFYFKTKSKTDNSEAVNQAKSAGMKNVTNRPFVYHEH